MSTEFWEVDSFPDEQFFDEWLDGEDEEEFFTPALIGQVVEQAARIVEQGWTQHRPFAMVDGTRCVCANGALWLATGLEFDEEGMAVSMGSRFDMDRHELWRAATEALSTHVGQESFMWNDSADQSKEQVVSTMLDLAQELRKE